MVCCFLGSSNGNDCLANLQQGFRLVSWQRLGQFQFDLWLSWYYRGVDVMDLHKLFNNLLLRPSKRFDRSPNGQARYCEERYLIMRGCSQI